MVDSLIGGWYHIRMDSQGLQFIDQPVEVIFDIPPALEKSPPCPNGFCWMGVTFRVEEMLAQWSSFERRGRMATNMAPEHAARAAGKGSWGVGRFFFRSAGDRRANFRSLLRPGSRRCLPAQGQMGAPGRKILTLKIDN